MRATIPRTTALLRTTAVLAAGLVLGTGLTSCAASADDRPLVVVTTNILGDVVGEPLGRPGPDARRVMFVGHEPDLSGAVALLTGAASVRMRKGGLACVEFYGIPEPGGGEIAWLIDPDLYTDDSEGD